MEFKPADVLRAARVYPKFWLFCDGNRHFIEIRSRKATVTLGNCGNNLSNPSVDLADCPERPTLMARAPLGGTRPRFLIADDYALFADALRVYLERTYTVVGVVQEGRALVAATLRVRPDVVIVDVAMPALNGLDAAKKIREVMPHVKFIFLAMRGDPNLAAAALELGAVGYVLKLSTGQELLRAIDHVLHDKPYLTPKLRADNWAAMKQRVKQYCRDMTSRQREVLQLIAEGRPLKKIAWLLDLSEKTIEFHKQHIPQSFNLKNNADFVLFALKSGLISQ
jgi:DNA-binding NarL/FixJ family response regulator